MYLLSHANRAYGAVTGASMDSAKALYDKLCSSAIKDEFSIRDVYRNNWSMLTSPKAVSEAAEILVDLGWLRSYSDKVAGTDGRPTVRYLVNPLIKKAA